MKILSLDPSGNFLEGQGTTGICILEDGKPVLLGEIKASDYECAERYWQAHKHYISSVSPDMVVIEGYRLYHHKGMSANTQANSILETPMLIGILRMTCFEFGIPLHIQYAAEVKTRWSEKVLTAKGYLEKKGSKYYFKGGVTNTHKRDALKHALHFWRYKM